MTTDRKSKRIPLRPVIAVLITVLAVALAVFPPPRPLVEAYYSTGLYIPLQHNITFFSNQFSFCLGDVLIALSVIGIPLWWFLALRFAKPGKRFLTAGKTLLQTFFLLALTYLWFAFFWGLNYSREPLFTRLDWAKERIENEKAKQVGQRVGSEVNRLAALTSVQQPDLSAPPANWQPDLQQSFTEVTQYLGRRTPIVFATPKRSLLLDSEFGKTTVTGCVVPFTLETILYSKLTPTEEAFVLAHEWAHIAGYASEAQADYIALLTCLNGKTDFIRYSGWLYLYRVLPRSALPADFELHPAAQEEIQEIRSRVHKNYEPVRSTYRRKAYDTFLKANRQQAGVASYGFLVGNVLATDIITPETDPTPFHLPRFALTGTK